MLCTLSPSRLRVQRAKDALNREGDLKINKTLVPREGALRAPLTFLAGLLSLSAAGVHLILAPEHFQEWWGYGVVFLVVALFQALYGLALLVRKTWLAVSSGYLLAGILCNLLVMEVYTVSRTLGIPLLGPHAGRVEEIGAIDVLSKALELGLVAALAAMLVRLPGFKSSFGTAAKLATAGFLIVSVALVLAGVFTRTEPEPFEAFTQSELQFPTAVDSDNHTATLSDEPYLIINVDMTGDGFQPSSIFIPAGRRVQVVLRNRGSTEHHFRVLGLKIREMLWLAPRENTADIGGDEELEHLKHHETSFVPFRATSPAGIKPMGDEVHAYAAPGAVDAVLFTATNTGTFLVHCPLHPEIIGKVTVYSLARRDELISLTPKTVATEDPSHSPAPKTIPTENPSQVSLKSAAILRELVPLLTRTARAKDGTELEALYEAPDLYELTGRTPPEPGTSVIAFTVSESVHDGVLPKGTTAFVLTVDDKGPFAPLKVRRLSDDSHHRTTEYLFPDKDISGSPLIKGGYQVLTLSVAPNGLTGTATATTLVWRLPLSPSTPSGTLPTVSLTDAQVIRVVGDDKGFNPNRLTLTKGKRIVLVFQNVGSKEHHLHALKMPAQDIWWFSPPQAGAPVPSDINTLRSAHFLPYHICDSESGICPSGLDVHLHARVGDWLAISFIPSTAGTFSMTSPVDPYMKGTIVVNER